ncbi:CPBP family intramembrane metalloprotease [Vallitalea pronyensis]|uniref:CPBP family intramembrane metalloprotease n=1 Tax=Vallitalea pronyensis TaxID=1348613 RepID=A0A8J8SF12_9FIRM|nr:type II CAAX endopeptidase family protein [Vallitalea pronyensis]QUI21146.1 CPBP family intramembrane metalloprotease [Vallitalea pronyensis]
MKNWIERMKYTMNSAKRGNRFVFLLILFSVIIVNVMGIILSIQERTLTTVQSILFSQVVLISLPIILYFVFTRANVKNTLLLHKMDTINVLLAIGIGIFIQPFLGLINLLSQIFFENQIAGTIEPLLQQPLWLLLTLVAVLPAINEEFLLRGILLTNYEHVPLVKAALMNGLFFGLLHQNANQFTYAFAMGIMLFLLVKITGSVYAGMIVHFIVNGTNMVLAKLLTVLQNIFSSFVESDAFVTAQTSEVSVLSALPLYLVMTLFSLPLVYLFYKIAITHNKKQHLFTKKHVDQDTLEGPKRKVFDGYVIGSIILFLIIFFLNELLPLLLPAA